MSPFKLPKLPNWFSKAAPPPPTTTLGPEHYTPLNPLRSEIRILCILPTGGWDPDSEIVCELKILSLDDGTLRASGLTKTNTQWTALSLWRLRTRFAGQPTTGATGSDLLECLGLSRWRMATDPRDHIYSILSMADADYVRLDYELPIEDLLCDLVIRDIAARRSLDILSGCKHFDPAERRSVTFRSEMTGLLAQLDQLEKLGVTGGYDDTPTNILDDWINCLYPWLAFGEEASS
ncbi:hypothetical protein OQA88_920 [Cercophora sp. LCS_1]